MNFYLLFAAIIVAATGALHSWLGERYILIRLFRRQNLPHLYGSDVFTKRTLRFAWHLTSIAWWGFAVILLFLATQPGPESAELSVVVIIRWTFSMSALVALVASRGRHPSWVLFGAVAAALWLVAV
ncbi:MAG: hypothetical protein ACE5FP_02665 [Gemmatimonadota bacterium]